MTQLRSLRRSRSLTYIDLAALSGIPARAIAEAEFGIRPLSPRQCADLALVLGLNDARTLFATAQQPMALTLPLTTQQALIALALAGSIALSSNVVAQRMSELPASLPTVFTPANSTLQADVLSGEAALQVVAPLAGQIALQSAATLVDTAVLRAVMAAQQNEQLTPALLVAQMPTVTAGPASQAAFEMQPLFSMSAEGPRGCPLQPTHGRVVITQGYGVGTHAPAAIWGAIDLAIDSDHDGYAEPGASWYTPVVATHDGVVTVTMESWPAGNHVWVRDSASPWKTGYAHLAIVSVSTSQYVSAGTVIGLVGSSGLSSGPHLDYQVWYGEQNVNPTNLVPC